jgi:SAM-dependent methyltransferase
VTAAIWDNIFKSRPWGKYPPESLVRSIARTYPQTNRSGVRMLELGCGPGAITWFLSREGFTVTGMDWSQAAIEQNHARHEAEKLPSPTLWEGDFTATMPFPPRSFDHVIDSVALYCNSTPKRYRAMQEVLRVLRPGGWITSLMFTDHTRAAPEVFGDKGEAYFLSLEAVQATFTAFEGLSIETTSYTLDERSSYIEMWVINGRKPS